MQEQLELLPPGISREDALTFLGVTGADEPIEFSVEASLSETYKFSTDGGSDRETSTWFLTLGSPVRSLIFGEAPADPDSFPNLISAKISYEVAGEIHSMSRYYLGGKLVGEAIGDTDEPVDREVRASR
ncbi:MAG: hypothetical protein ACI8XO_002881 [Verrucomicrobiales bacterium]|jgi:hypothetical protein